MNPVQLSAVLMAGTALLMLGGGTLVMRKLREEARLARQRALNEQAPSGGDPGGPPRLFDTLNKVGGAVSSGGKTSRTLKGDLAAAGYHSRSAATVYLGTKALLFLLGIGGLSLALIPAGMSGLMTGCLIVCGASILFFIPNIVVSVKRGQRRAEVRRHLPDAVDMLEICVSAGMGLDAAWTSVSEEIRRVSTVFADEMELTSLEISLGVPRGNALRHMAERTGADDLSSLVALLVQSERFGAGIIEALTTFARTMREARSQRAEEAAEKMSVKLLFPMVMFIFPALLIVMVGPAVIAMMKVMGGNS